jgi:hypothetical protein
MASRVLDLYGVAYSSLPGEEKQALLAALDTMNRDPLGKPIGRVDTAAGIVSGAKDSGRVDGVAASKVAGAKKGKVTSKIVGRKEIIVPIAALLGKGYPAPVNPDIVK